MNAPEASKANGEAGRSTKHSQLVENELLKKLGILKLLKEENEGLKKANEELMKALEVQKDNRTLKNALKSCKELIEFQQLI